MTLLTHGVTDGTQTQTAEAERRRCHALHLTYPNIIAEPGEVLLRAVIVTNLLVAASYMSGKEKRGRAE